MSALKEALKIQAENANYIVLGTIGDNGLPALRVLGSYAVGDNHVYFSTPASSRKIQHIKANPGVSILIQKDGQKSPDFSNIALSGKARVISDKAEFTKVAELIAARSPRFKQRLANGEIGTETALVQVDLVDARITDLSKGPGAKAVTILDL